MPSPRLRPTALVACAVLALGALSACSTGQDRVSTVSVVEPGLPGEPATVHPPGTEFEPVDSEFSEADVAFVAGMVPHHEQAVRMAELAPERAQDPRVLGLAARIADVQDAEIGVLTGWLDERDLTEDGLPAGRRGHTGHESHDEGHGGHGMATEEDLVRLAGADGAQFDRLWLELMIAHHAGALRMAEDRQRDGGLDIRAGELAADVTVEQLAEIRRMEGILAEL